MKISYHWLKWYLPELPNADKLSDIFTFHVCEVDGIEKLENGDAIFDLKVLPDRAHDLLSHQGVARELAGLLGLTYNDPRPLYTIPEAEPTKLTIAVESDKCRRYMARVVRNVTVGPSPEWLIERLASIGQRSINNVVDATNLTLFDCGQPVHVFDADKITNYELKIKNAKDGEKLTLLDGKEIELTESDLVIADEKGNLLALAGIKGGKYAEVTSETKNIIIEVGNFDGTTVRKSAKRLGLFTDALKRFENEVPLTKAPFGMMEVSSVIAGLSEGAVFEEIVDIEKEVYQEQKVSFSLEYINQILGLTLISSDIEAILKRYGYFYEYNNDIFSVVVPEGRTDISGPHDMAEEIGRVIGYDKVVPLLPKIDFLPKVNETYYKILAVRKKLLGEGYSEVMTYGFTSAGDVEVLASASDKKFLRNNLIDGLKASVTLNQANAPLLGEDTVKVFEIGTVFLSGKEEIHVAYGDKKEITEITLEEFCEKNSIVTSDTYGDLLPPCLPERQASNLPTGEEGSHLPPNSFNMWSLYPFITRDIALWVSKEISSDAIIETIKKFGGPLLVREPRLVDEYHKDDKTSYAFRLVFQSDDRTLTDIEVNELMNGIQNELEKQGFSVR
jgi:phenylalanyl-tRNA synthetase beta subunit